MFICKICNQQKPEDSYGVYYSKINEKFYRKLRCNSCERERGKIYDKKRTESGNSKLRAKKYYTKHKARRLESNKRYRNKNKEHVNKWHREYFTKRYNNDSEFKEKMRIKSIKTDKRRNKDSILSKIFIKEILEVYKECRRLTKVTGIRYEVDHIIPIKHKNVCGLHVPWNLQILTKHENSSKNNIFDFTIDNLTWKTKLASY